jgi:hypothetical protein
MFRPRTGLATCLRCSGPGRDRPPARMSPGAHVARFLRLYFAQTASPILVLRRGAMLAQNRSNDHSVRVAAGGARWGRLCVNGWKNRLGAGARSASVSCSPCMAERSGLRARSELHGAGPEPIFPAKSEWSTVGASGDRHARAPTGHRLPRPPAKRQPSPQPSPGGRGSKESALGQRIGKYVVAGFRSERPMPTRGDQHVLAAIVTEVRHRRGLAARG